MRLAIFMLALGFVVPSVMPAATGSGCEGANTWTHCEVSNSGTGVDIGAGQTRPGGGGSPGSGDGRSNPGAPDAAPAEEECDPSVSLCRDNYVAVSLRDITLADLESFHPATPSVTGEPLGFGLVGAPTNRIASATSSEVEATILDLDVVVRFTPTGFVFDNGDGSVTSSSTGGAPWSSLGLAQFTPTSTTHVYREPGTFPVGVSVQFVPEVRFQGATSWYRVPGLVTASAGGYDVRVVEARTALVDRTCLEDHRGTGC